MGVRAKRARSIIIYRTGQLGDTLVSLPAIRAIRDNYPNHELILLTDQHPGKGFVSSWEVLEAAKLFSEVLFYTPPLGRLVGWLSLFGLARQIRQRGPESLFYLRDPHWNHARRDTFFFQVLCGIPHCYGIDPQTKQLFGRRDISGNLIRYPNEVDYLLKVVSMSGVIVPEPGKAEFTLLLSDKERARINSLWSEKDISNEVLLVGIAPGSKMPAKRWPLDRFIEVGKWVLVKFPACRVIIFGSSEEREQGEEMRRVLGNQVVNLAGELTVLESAEALRRCHVYIGNDTGVMHLAAAVGTTCVAIFSARDHPGRWEPYGPNHITLRTDPSCSGCLLEVCIKQNMKCLDEISVDKVINAVQCIIGQGSVQKKVFSKSNLPYEP